MHARFTKHASRRQRSARRARPRFEPLENRLAPAGALDPLFGNDGIVLVSQAPYHDWRATDMAVQTDGKLVVSGYAHVQPFGTSDNQRVAVVCRLNPDGSPDETFGGGDGITTTPVPDLYDVGGVALQGDGKVLVAAVVRFASGTGASSAMVLRYGGDGELDPTFGDGDGIVVFNPHGHGFLFGERVAVQDDGAIVVSGGRRDGDFPDYWIARFTTNGAPDLTFGGGDGMVSDSSNVYVFDLTTRNGKILLSGNGGIAGDIFGPVLLRHNADGSVDNTFGDDGRAAPRGPGPADGGGGHVVQVDGRIYAAATSYTIAPSAVGVLRFLDDGTLDTAFGSGGHAYAPVSSGGGGSHVGLQRDGAVVVVGDGGTSTNRDLVLVRFKPGGAVDSSFGTNGVVVADINAGSDDHAEAFAVQGNRLVVAGRAGRQLVVAGFQTSSAVSAADDTFALDEDVPALLDVLANDTGPDATVIHSFGQPQHGTLTREGGALRYTPAENYHGPDQFRYTSSDGQGSADVALVQLTVRPVNDPPRARPDSATTPQGSGTLVNVQLNDDTVPDAGETLAIASFTTPTHGDVVNFGSQLRYIPEAAFVGQDSFDYTLRDSNGGEAVATVTVTVTASSAPLLANDDVAVVEDAPDVIVAVLDNDSGPTGATLTIQTFTQPAHGHVTRIGQTLRYRPNAGFTGADYFGYLAADDQGHTDAAVVDVNMIRVATPTSTALSSSSPAGAAYGQTVTFTATVTSADASMGTPGGAIQFAVDGVDAGPAVPLTDARASLPLSLGAGDHAITATFISDVQSILSSTTAAPLMQTVSRASLTITANDATKVYGAPVPGLTVTPRGLVNGDTLASLDTAPTITTAATVASDVGGYAVAVAGAADANYLITFAPGTLTVTPAPLAIAADNQTMVEGSAVPPLTMQFSGFVNGDSAASLDVAAVASTTAGPASPPGAYPITVTASDRNYTITFVAGTLTILPGPPRPLDARSPVPLPLRVSAPRTIMATGTVATLRRVTLSGPSAQAQVRVRVHTTQGKLLLRMRGVKVLGNDTGRLTLIGKRSLVERALRTMALRLARPRSQAMLTLTATAGRQVWTTLIRVRS